MMLSFLILNLFLWSIVGIQLSLYNTDQTLDIGNLQVNCLHYYNRDLPGIIENIEYCLGPIDNNYSLNDDFLHIHGQYLTFDKLRQLNITVKELLLWSATIDLAEQYQYYLENEDNSSLSREIFFNCTKPWFGPQCQFSFDSTTTDSFKEIVQNQLKKMYTYKSSYNITSVTCYTHLKCDRGGSGICLDWREVCDGRIDCINGGNDEEKCFDLEINECNEDEYRCHNGLCIPKEFLNSLIPICLDKSDMQEALSLFPSESSPILYHKEYSCLPSSKQFVCSDEECVAHFDECKNNRHLLLIESISDQGNLSYTCWMTMICLTKILDQINKTSCDQLLRSSDIDTYLHTCDNLIQFPTIAVLFGHVRFLYDMKEAKDWNIDLLFLPDYICYDDQLCDFIIPTYRNGNYSCRHRHQFNFDLNVKHKTWSSFIHLVENYFRKCLIKYNKTDVKTNSHHSSLYCCKNSSKCISKHRILDNISDCYLNDDEEQFELSCLINHVRRFKCNNENKCYASSVPSKICPPSVLRNFNEIPFRELCGRLMNMFPVIIDGQNHTDETDCEHWPCNNFYTRCDGFWNCPDGEDEENCTTPVCPSHSLPCVTSYNYTFTCLSANQVGNGHIDCLGAIDEGQHCRSLRYLENSYLPYRCRDDDTCVGRLELCNRFSKCPHEDDEKFCKNHHFLGICEGINAVDRTDVENAICLTINMNKIQFSLKTSPIYPPSKNKTFGHIAHQPIQQSNSPRLITNELDDSAWLWRCNHGLYVRHWLGGNNFTHKCFCPPSYYGNICQYQNQRVSLTIQLIILNTKTVYAIIISLIDDDDDRQQIISYHQYNSVAECKQNYNAFLPYSTRPKNSSTNYSVRIDVYNKTSLTYFAGWHFTVPFSFLPVNRMAVVLYVPAEEVHTPSICPLKCHNSKCMKYMNKEKFYCQCDAGWSGVRCDIPVRCNDCSLHSMCVGVIYNRSICICPLNKGGPRCLFTLSCPDSFCYNNGTCLVLDHDMNKFYYKCICPMGFSGSPCVKLYTKLDIFIHNIKVSSVLLIFLDPFLDDGHVAHKVIAQKLTIFQRSVSVYSENPIQMAVVKTDDSYYLAVLQHISQKNICTSIDSSRRCTPIIELLSIEQLTWHEIRRVKSYHKICQTHLYIICFIDDPYMCLCTLEHHANCFRFDSTPPKCRDKFYCRNGGTCLQDYPDCPLTIMCNCTDCFFGNQCQFYAKGVGLTLDDILRYEIRPHVSIHDQSSIIKWSAALTMIIFVAGLINSILSLLTFHTKQSREIGCGMYLLASSITSFLTVSFLTVKFWFLILTQINPSVSRSVLRGSCISLEFILKVCLYLNNWFNACVALERMITVYKGIHFNKMSSKRIARWIIFILPLFIMVSIIHEPLYRDLFDDKDEQRFWCVFNYSSSVQIYHTIIILFHFIGPFCANLLSALFIIFASTRRRAITQQRLTYNQHLREQFKEHKNLIISAIILVILAIPGLIISISSHCAKESYNSWLYLWGYLISFIPSMTSFIVFVIPSDFYKKQFKTAIKFGRR